MKRIVLGHAHEDHRGAAPAWACRSCATRTRPRRGARAPLDDDRGMDLSKLESRVITRGDHALLNVWDGGPVKIADTVDGGRRSVAGFKVMLTPGHAPGQIALVASRTGSRWSATRSTRSTRQRHARLRRPAHPPPRVHAGPRLPRATRSCAIAALEPKAVWAGHAEPRDRRLQGPARARRRDDLLTWRPRASSRGHPAGAPGGPLPPFTEEHEELRESIRRFVAKELRPHVAAVGGRRVVPQRRLPQDGRASASSG